MVVPFQGKVLPTQQYWQTFQEHIFQDLVPEEVNDSYTWNNEIPAFP